MDRKRGEDKNWYTLSIEERARQMNEHGLVGGATRAKCGRLSRARSDSTIGVGVDLFADDPLVFKKLIYEMRFDHVSAVYALFGQFYVGLRCPASNSERFLGRIAASKQVILVRLWRDLNLRNSQRLAAPVGCWRRPGLPDTNDLSAERPVSTLGLIEYKDASPEVRAVYDDIMTTRKTDWINNFWKAIAQDPATLKRTWEDIKQVMGRARSIRSPRNWCTWP